MHKPLYITPLLLSLLFIHISALSMIMVKEFTPFPQLAPELKSLVIDQVDNMSFIGQTNKECYAIVQKKQIDYIIRMHDKQDPSLAQFNITPFVFLGAENDFGGKYALNPNSKTFYKWPTQEKYFSQDENTYKNFHSTITWNDPYKHIEPTNLLINIFKRDINGIKALLIKQYKLVPEKIYENQHRNMTTKNFLMYAYYTAKKLGLSDIITILEQHGESEKINFKNN